MTLDVLEFMRRFLQHVLPHGFQKVRYFGFMGAGCKIAYEEIAVLIELCLNFVCRTPQAPVRPVKKLRCPACGGRMVLDTVVLPQAPTVLVPGDST